MVQVIPDKSCQKYLISPTKSALNQPFTRKTSKNLLLQA